MNLRCEYLGLSDFAEVNALQLRRHAEVLQDQNEGVVIGCEHPAVVTRGANLSDSVPAWTGTSLPVIDCDRGGLLTVHSPGQLVIYPILPLRRWGIGTRDFVAWLEAVTCDVLQDFGLSVDRGGAEPGLFCGGAKIGSVGLRIDRGVSRHGLALNLTNDLSLFGGLEICGWKGRPMTSLRRELPTLDPIRWGSERVFREWFRLFHLQLESKIANCKPQEIVSP